MEAPPSSQPPSPLLVSPQWTGDLPCLSHWLAVLPEFPTAFGAAGNVCCVQGPSWLEQVEGGGAEREGLRVGR